jgi:hypothetical protein
LVSGAGGPSHHRPSAGGGACRASARTADVVDGNFISSRHPRDVKFFTGAIVQHRWRGAKTSPFDDGFSSE